MSIIICISFLKQQPLGRNCISVRRQNLWAPSSLWGFTWIFVLFCEHVCSITTLFYY